MANTINLFIKRTLLFCLIALTVLSCSKDSIPEDQKTISQENTGSNGEPDSTTDSEETNTVEDIDRQFFDQMKKAGDVFNLNEIWKGYDFATRPMYIIYRNSSGEPVRGYLINPKSDVPNARKITGEAAEGLNVYSYDTDLIRLNNDLQGGNDLYTFDFLIDGQPYYGQQYSDTDVQDTVNSGALSTAAHEMFHGYQFSNFVFSTEAKQDEMGYPLTAELLALQILTNKIAEKMPEEKSTAKVKKYLEMYVAVRTKEIELDPSEAKLVKNMANHQERIEGTAKYVDAAVSAKLDSSYINVYGDYDSTNITDAAKVREDFAFSIWYATGAAVTYMLKNQLVDVETAIATGKTLYDIAEETVNLTTSQKAQKLLEAQDEFGWPAIQTEAQRLANLE